MFTFDTTLSIGENGDVSGGVVLTIDASRLNLPIPRFNSHLTKLDSPRVYSWKVIGIPDST